MPPFDIVYFDGKNSKLHQGKLTFIPDFWEITLSNNEEIYATILWEINKINATESVGGVNTFKYGTYPQETLECQNPQIVNEIKSKYPSTKLFSSTSHWALTRGLSSILAIALCVILLGFAFYKLALPPIASHFAQQIPQSYEEQLGNLMLDNIVNQDPKETSSFSYTKNNRQSVLANKFASQINFNSSYKINVTVVNSEQINAFALPGGNVVVFSGLLKKLKTKEEFAALLGHEVAHINKKHSLKNIFRSLSGYLFLSLVTSDINGITTIILENANNLSNLSYSRELETEADAYAIEVLNNNKINPVGLLKLFKVLKNESKFEPYEILNSHPLTNNRIAFAKKHLKPKQIFYQNTPLQNAWLNIKKAK